MVWGKCVTKKMTAKAATVAVWDGSVDTSWYDREAKSFKISNASQLAGLAQLVNRGETMYGKKITITADIYLNRDWGNYDSWGNLAPDNQWTPIGSYQHAFRGTIDGNNHCVYGIYINMQENVQGLFGRVETNSDYDEQAIKDWHIKILTSEEQAMWEVLLGALIGWILLAAALRIVL